MRDFHTQSPEARRQRLAKFHARFGADAVAEIQKRGTDALTIVKRVVTGVYNDGFIHAGNLAFTSLLALFPFLILASAVAQLIGKSQNGELAVVNLLSRLPSDVAAALAGPINEVLLARTGPLLWFGAVVGMWTAASFIETIRDILRRAYGVTYSAPFWHYRLGSIGLILALVLMLMAAFGATVLMTSIHHAVIAVLPESNGLAHTLGLYRLLPGATLYLTFYALFLALTPSRYRKLTCRKWPGALLVTAWWLLTVELLPDAIGLFGGYAITYGSLAGVMVAMIFFWIIGLGVVAGAELNAALADPGDRALKGEHYDGPYSGELKVDEPAEDELVVQETEGKAA